jgi:hypothetical protein
MTENALRAAAGPQDASSSPLLEIADVTIRFGGIVALESVTFSVGKGRTVARRHPAERALAEPLRAG